MSKKATLQLHINTPCSENRENMDKRPEGFFCHACQKEVVDFRTKSTRELRQFFDQNTDKVCGLFRTDQIATPLPPLPKPVTPAHLKLAAMALTALTTTQGCTMGEVQRPQEHAMIEQPTKSQDPKPLKSTISRDYPFPNRISGQIWQVCDDTMPHTGDFLQLKNSDVQIPLAKDGRFSFDLPADFQGDKIELMLYGHPIRTIQRDELPLLDCQIYYPLTIMGDVICNPKRKTR